jgi:DedD protein
MSSPALDQRETHMNHLLDADLDQHPDAVHDREISLGTATILGIFFALALVCAAFFGFGYTLGRKSAQGTGQTTVVQASTAPITVKPAAGSVAGQPSPAPAPVVASAGPAFIPASQKGVTPSDAMIAGDRPAGGSAVFSAAAQPAPAISPGGAFMVQIAAVSSQDIADIEVTALKKYGFDVIVRHEPQDQLLHVQIGPYTTRKDAEAMRANVQSHGFNAIVK